MVIKVAPNQLTLELEPGIVDRFGSLREVIATGVYQRGLKRCAIDLDMAPSNLSVQLSEDPARHFSVDSLERYIELTGDKTPIEYLIARFYGAKQQTAELAEIRKQFAALQTAMKNAGVA